MWPRGKERHKCNTHSIHGPCRDEGISRLQQTPQAGLQTRLHKASPETVLIPDTGPRHRPPAAGGQLDAAGRSKRHLLGEWVSCMAKESQTTFKHCRQEGKGDRGGGRVRQSERQTYREGGEERDSWKQ